MGIRRYEIFSSTSNIQLKSNILGINTGCNCYKITLLGTHVQAYTHQNTRKSNEAIITERVHGIGSNSSFYLNISNYTSNQYSHNIPTTSFWIVAMADTPTGTAAATFVAMVPCNM